jgi:DNA-directed RNA polymerase specialized sigma24 family protein
MDYREFFERNAPRLVRLCLLTTLDREAAADAAQEALTRAWRDWARVGAAGSDPAAWTRTVALNLCRNRWRRLARQARLAPRTYIVDCWADLDVDACVRAMAVSPGSVKQHLSRARRRLAAELGAPSLDLEVETHERPA